MASPSRRRRPPSSSSPSSPGGGKTPLSMDPPPTPVDSSSDPGLRAHLLRQRHWQRHQEEHQQQHPFPPPPPPPMAPSASAQGGGGHRPLLLRLRDGQAQGQQVPSPAALLVEDQFALSRFWSDWRAAEHRFLTKATTAEAAAGRGGASSSSSSRFGATAAAGGASRPGGSNASGSRRQRAPDPHWLGQGDDEDGEEEDEEMELEGALEALLREGPRRAPSPLSASAGAAGAKLLDGTGDDAKQPPRGAAAEAAAEAEAEGGQARNGNGNANGNGKGHGDKDKEEPSAAEEALAARVRELEARLVETEALLGSDPGTVILALERDLAQAKLALAHTEAEKDELEVQLCNMQQARGHW